MDAPKCRVCGAKHWAHEAHEFAEEDLPAREVMKVGKDRKAYLRDYMREYMRKRRSCER